MKFQIDILKWRLETFSKLAILECGNFHRCWISIFDNPIVESSASFSMKSNKLFKSSLISKIFKNVTHHKDSLWLVVTKIFVCNFNHCKISFTLSKIAFSLMRSIRPLSSQNKTGFLSPKLWFLLKIFDKVLEKSKSVQLTPCEL